MRLKVNVESTTAFGWPKDDVTISIPDTAVGSKTLKMTAKTGFVHIDGFVEIQNKKVKAEAPGWTLEAEQDLSIRPGSPLIEMTLKLKGVNVVFELLDAATPPVGVANEKMSVFREDGTAVPGAPAQTDGVGLVTLTNVPPETYKGKAVTRSQSPGLLAAGMGGVLPWIYLRYISSKGSLAMLKLEPAKEEDPAARWKQV